MSEQKTTLVKIRRFPLKKYAEEVSLLFDTNGEAILKGNNKTLSDLMSDSNDEGTEKEYREKLHSYIQNSRRSQANTSVNTFPPSSFPPHVEQPTDLTELLHYACALGREELFRDTLHRVLKESHLCNFNRDFRDKNTSNCTLMHKAARYDRVDIMNILIEHGATIDTHDSLDSTPLFYAAAGNAVNACQLLICYGALINIRDKFDNIVALRSNSLDAATIMIMSKADLSFKGSGGNTCLHMVCEEGSLEKLKYLMEKGAPVSRTNRDDETCLFTALPHPILINYLCEYVKSSASENRFISLIRMRNVRGMTVVHKAAADGHLDSLLTITNHFPALTKASMILYTDLLNERSKSSELNPLHLSVINKRHEIVRLFTISQEIDFSIPYDTSNGDTILHYAIRERYDIDMIIMIIKGGGPALLKMRNHERDTPRMIAKKIASEESFDEAVLQCSTVRSKEKNKTPRSRQNSLAENDNSHHPSKIDRKSNDGRGTQGKRSSIINLFSRSSRKSGSEGMINPALVPSPGQSTSSTVESPPDIISGFEPIITNSSPSQDDLEQAKIKTIRRKISVLTDRSLLETLRIPSSPTPLSPIPDSPSTSVNEINTMLARKKRLVLEVHDVLEQEFVNKYRVGFLLGSLMECSSKTFEKEEQLMVHCERSFYRRHVDDHLDYMNKLYDFHSLCLVDMVSRDEAVTFGIYLKNWIEKHELVDREMIGIVMGELYK
ncbi:26S proteasome non-ATPase regulatory subunit 10 [Acrasis kona]|uniref:26S proteasome non-ATPase regulatory subunit 10 n=1 Tax=Acrasis kona TaxID=1008807 RepID=A0AAW2Z2H4_9EUKA